MKCADRQNERLWKHSGWRIRVCIMSLVTVACFLPGWAKYLSAPPFMVWYTRAILRGNCMWNAKLLMADSIIFMLVWAATNVQIFWFGKKFIKRVLKYMKCADRQNEKLWKHSGWRIRVCIMIFTNPPTFIVFVLLAQRSCIKPTYCHLTLLQYWKSRDLTSKVIRAYRQYDPI